MKAIKIYGMIVFFIALLTCIAAATTVTIDPSGYAAGTDLGNPYPGVTLTAAQGYVDFVDYDPTPTLVETIRLTGPDLGTIFAQGPYMAGIYNSNIYWASDPQFAPTTVFKATFTVPVDFVSMTYIPDDTDTGVLGVFDSEGNLLSHQYLRTSGTFSISYTSSNTPIAYILAGYHDPGYLGALTFRVKDVTPILSVKIDIKPGSTPNSINMRSQGKIPVAILSSADFNAPLQVDSTSLTFGRTGDEPSFERCNPNGEDVNRDGLRDLVCHFTTQATGFTLGDTMGILKGKTNNGELIGGTDSVSLVPPRHIDDF